MFQQRERLGQWSVDWAGNLALGCPLDADAKGTRQNGDFPLPAENSMAAGVLPHCINTWLPAGTSKGRSSNAASSTRDVGFRVHLLFGGHSHGRPGDANAGQSAGHFGHVPGRDDQVAASLNIGLSACRESRRRRQVRRSPPTANTAAAASPGASLSKQSAESPKRSRRPESPTHRDSTHEFSYPG